MVLTTLLLLNKLLDVKHTSIGCLPAGSGNVSLYVPGWTNFAKTPIVFLSLHTFIAHVLHPRSLLLVHLPSPLWTSLIALFSMLHLVYGTNSPLIFTSLARHSLLHFHLSHMAVHHHLLHHLYDHHLHLLLLVQSFTLNLRLGSSANHFLHRPFPFLPD